MPRLLAMVGFALVVLPVSAANAATEPLGAHSLERSDSSGAVARAGADIVAGADVAEIPGRDWAWPLPAPFRLVERYVAPAHAYGPGHRGIDVAPLGAASVLAPADGVVAFAGRVVDRTLVTIDHGGGLVSTLEPVDTSLVVGGAVVRGDPVGTLSVGGHTDPGRLHLGVRWNGEYINPLLLLGGIPRAVLLPLAGR